MNADVPDPCATCGGSCCSFREMGISYLHLDEGQRYDSLMLEHDNINDLVRENGDPVDFQWFVVTLPEGRRYLAFECEHWVDGKCSIHDDRPELCRSFECDFLSGDMDFEEFEDRHLFDGGVPDEYEVREVTERVNEIVERRVGGESD